MQQDAQGNAISTAGADVRRAFDHTIAGYLATAPTRRSGMQALLAADPDCGMAHALKGDFACSATSRPSCRRREEAMATAGRLTARATPREQAHVAALAPGSMASWTGRFAVWDGILRRPSARHPRLPPAPFRPLLARPAGDMLASVEGVLPRWSAELPGYGSVLACRCFAHEECGNYTLAEAAGRAAIELDPGDLWAAHAVAHVLEMQGRRSEGIAWIAGLEPQLGGRQQHQAPSVVAPRDVPPGARRLRPVLALYDHGFRNLPRRSPQAQPDLYIDVQNAASMLFRLELQGVDVGDRWDGAGRQGRGADRRLPVGLHLAALDDGAGRDRALGGGAAHAGRHARLRRAATPAPTRRWSRRYALPVCEAVLRARAGRPCRRGGA